MITLKSIKNSTKIIISLGLVSRVLNFVKGILIASFIGVNFSTDTYLLAFSATMLLTKIISDGLSVSLIPIYQQIDKRDGLKGRNEFTNNVINSYIVLSIILITVGYIIAPIVIKILGPGFVGLERIRAISLFRLGLPIMTFHFIRGVCVGHLQSIHAFKAGARSGVVNGMIYIIYLITLSKYFGLEGLIITGIIAVIGQIYVLMKAMIKVGYKYKFYIFFKDKLLIRLNSLLVPIIVGIGINEVNLAVDNAVGSVLQQGTISELNYAYNIILFFITAFIIAIVTAIFPLLAESFNKEEEEDLRGSINFSFKLLTLILIPTTIILMTMAEPITKLFYERGAFGNDATIKTAQVLIFYSIGIIGMSFILLINRIYYAIHEMNTTVVLGILALGTNIILDLVLAKYMGANGIALGTSISVIITSIYGVVDLNRRLGFLSWKTLIIDIIRRVIAVVIMISVITTINTNFGSILGATFIGNLFLVILTSLFGVITFAAIIFVTKSRSSYHLS